MLKKYKPYIIQILIALLVGGLAGLLTRGSFNVYGELIKPALAPPPIVFPIVWGILYVLMGISAGIVYQTEGRIPFIYWLQLFVNFLWPIIFFNMQAFLFAFVWIVLLLILIVFMIIEFYRIHKTAAYLQIPYLLWTLFATYLTFFIWLYSTYWYFLIRHNVADFFLCYFYFSRPFKSYQKFIPSFIKSLQNTCWNCPFHMLH